jgi:flagellar basal-body rod protein FlgC
MDFDAAFRICASGLAAQRARLDVVTSNLANADTTKTAAGGPYRRRYVVFGSEELPEEFPSRLREALRSVKVEQVAEDQAAGRTVYDPLHPDADARGYVTLPNVNVMQEMTEMIASGRAYEACVSAFDASKSMALKTLDLGK